MTDLDWDVIVIGAGAAGLFAATRAAERGRRTLLLEKNRKPGVKILMSGGTRCNITQATDARGIIRAYGRQGKFLHSALAALGPEDVIQLFHQEQVPTKVESTGKVFPVSDKSLHVQQALLHKAQRSCVELRTGVAVTGIQKSNQSFLVTGNQESWTASSVVITTGGQSYPGCGTTGDGYGWAREFGHTIVSPRPALVPLVSPADWVHRLSGLTLPDVQVAVVFEADKSILAHGRGSLLLTHFGVSGPVAMNVSRAVSGHPQPDSLSLTCDCLPDRSLERLAAEFQSMSGSHGRSSLLGQLAELLPKRLAETILQLADIDVSRRCAELTRIERTRLIHGIKQLSIPLTGTLGFEKAEVTAGGVALDEIDSKSMQSRLVPGLFFAGEILDLDGPIGGYNFQAAFSTGYLAGCYA